MRKLYEYGKIIAGWPLSLIALFFVSKLIFSSSVSYTQLLNRTNLWLLLLGIFFYLLYFFFRTFTWQQIMLYHGHKVTLKHVAFSFGFAELRRYIPGNIWSFFSRATVFEKKGIDPIITGQGLVTEVILLMIGSAINAIFAVPLAFYALNLHIDYKLPALLYILLLLIAVIIFIYHKNLFPKSKNKLLQKLPSYTPAQAGTLLLIAVTEFAFYSLGTLFTLLAITYLPPQHLWQIFSLGSAAYLLGYLSFLTPSGLGIREAALVGGLTRFLSLSLASFAAVFSRIALIFAELIFLLLSFIFEKNNNKKVEQVSTFIATHKQFCLLVFFVIIYCSYFITASIFRYNNFYTGRFDLGNMDQTVWNTLHGRIFELTNPDSTNITSRLGTHADFILILLAPIYWIWSDPRMLLIVQTLVLASGAFFVYLLGNKILKNKTISLLIATCYLLNPSIEFSNLYDFHPVTLATTFLLATFYFLLQRRYKLFALFLFLSVLTKEEIWVIAAFFGVYLAIMQKKRIAGVLLAVLGFTTFYLLIAKIIPNVRGGEHFALSYYSDFGNSPFTVIKNILLHPIKIGSIILAPAQLTFLKELFLPLCFTPLLAPLLLLFALPDFTIDLLGNNTAFHQIFYQYTAAITPFLFIASLFGIKQLTKIVPISSLLLVSIVFLTTCYSAYEFGPLAGMRDENVYMFTNQLSYARTVDSYLQHIPAKYSIAASNTIGSHLSHRQRIYTIPVGIDKADIVIFLLNDKTAFPSLKAQKQLAEKLKHDKNYVLTFEEKDFVVFEKASIYPSQKRSSNRSPSIVHFIQNITKHKK